MAKSFKCADAGVVCDAEIIAESEDEVLAQAIDHAREAHGVDLTASKTLAKYAQSAITETDKPVEAS